MRRAFSIALALLLVFGLASVTQPPGATAQQAAATGAIIYGSSGEPLLEISIDSFTDGFDGTDSFTSPQRGFRFVHITATITNVAAIGYSPSYYQFSAIDIDGFVTESGWFNVDQSRAYPLLSSNLLEPGQSVTGSVIFEMLAGTEVAAIVYEYGWDRAAVVASNGVFPAAGEVQTVHGSEGGVIGTVSIDDWLDPLTDVDTTSSTRGHHYVGAVVTIENTSNRPFTVSAGSFSLIDADGFLLSGQNYWRQEPEIPSLEYLDLAPGESITGVVGFQVYNEAGPAFLIFSPTSQLQVLVAAFDDAPATQLIADIPAIDEIEIAGAIEVSEECREAEAWAGRLFERGSALDELEFEIEDANDMTVEELETVRDAWETFRADQATDQAPEVAAEFEEYFLAVVDYQIDGLNQLIEAKEDGEDVTELVAELDAGLQEQLGGYISVFTALGESCPNLNSF